MGAQTKTAKKPSPYSLKKPCPDCPFRKDKEFYLRPGRAKEIADAIRGGYEFPCHKTTVDSEDDEGYEERVVGPNTKACAGSLIVQHREGYANQMVRIAERIGMLDMSTFDLDAPVYGSLSEWVRAGNGDEPVRTVVYDGEVLEFEHCGIVAEDCEDPAGYAMGGGVAENDDPPTCHPIEDVCASCANPMCSACRATPNDDPDGPRCVQCVEDDDDNDSD